MSRTWVAVLVALAAWPQPSFLESPTPRPVPLDLVPLGASTRGHQRPPRSPGTRQAQRRKRARRGGRR